MHSAGSLIPDNVEPAYTLWMTPAQIETIEKAAASFSVDPEEYVNLMIQNKLLHLTIISYLTT